MSWLEIIVTVGIGFGTIITGYLVGRRNRPSRQATDAGRPLDPAELLAEAVLEPGPAPGPQDERAKLRRELEHEMHRLQNAERELLAHRAYSESVFQAAQAGLMIIDTDTWQIMDVNEAGARILGCEPDDLIGDSVRDYARNASPLLTAAIARGRTISNRQFVMTDRAGQEVPTIGSVTKMWGQTANLVVASFLDISEIKKKEAELVAFNDKLSELMGELTRSKQHIAQSEKLASIGQLAAGVAHEINNPVGFVTSNLGTVQEYAGVLVGLLHLYRNLETTAGPERDELVAKIVALREEEDLDFILEDLTSVLSESMEGVRRVTEIVQNLKSFARSDAPTLEIYDLNEGLEQMIRMTWNELKYHCTIEREYGEIPPVMCHPGQVNQVLVNMLVNASQAIGEEGGTVTVGTREIDGMVEISIADTGHGMDPEVIQRIFDPFFTTKEVGKGTGLGLSISHGIIRDHQGHIEVDSAPGRGTTFRIYLPVPEEEAAGSASASGSGSAQETETAPGADELAAVFESGDDELIG